MNCATTNADIVNRADKALPQEWDVGVENPSYMISVFIFRVGHREVDRI